MQAEYYTDEKGGQHMKLLDFNARIVKLTFDKFAALPISNPKLRWKQVPGYTIIIQISDCTNFEDRLESCVCSFQKDKIAKSPGYYKPYQIKS